ncbi:hypothetical protein ASE63_23620 [Bosea sp. Root381]|uniref:DUF4381 domain-containing protein n=1 Tax=Bosea sp. Root381 TaxID=1736524 RepID=UPI000713E8E7|nr:DUF4381 domain-containing protein [Bosea sp. Root381]KRE06700.1 hypothetical protein ASE63_23620 [Bosea sp. Root381]
MSSDPGDLANLADLALPPPVSFWPPAPGVWIVGGTLLAMLLVAAWQAARRYQADAYLREAHAELDRLGPAPSIEGVSEILKRAALVAFGRAHVASLTGKSWGDFLIGTTSCPVDDLVARLNGPGPHANDRAAAQAHGWLRDQRGRVSRET